MLSPLIVIFYASMWYMGGLELFFICILIPIISIYIIKAIYFICGEPDDTP